MKVKIGKQEFDHEAVVALMDDDLREELHSSQEWKSDQQFVDAYCKAHKKRFGTDFVVN
jgi:Anti-CRISPR protein AcrIC5